MPIQVEFGYFPKPLDFAAGDVSVATLPGLEDKTREVMESGLIEGDWCYAPPAQAQDFMSGGVRTLPHPSRIFRLPKTHSLTHATSNDPEDLGFLIWMLGFIYGIRLSETEAGFLDATPIRAGLLHDMVWRGKSEQKALGIADAFWQTRATAPDITKGMTGVVHSLFLGQIPTLLDFERFIYLYVALDGCHAVWCAINGKKHNYVPHSERIARLCSAFNRPIPTWADTKTGTVARRRNETLHEGLFFEEPLGFRTYGRSAAENTLLEMRCLVCRFVCALVGFNDTSYIRSAVNTRQYFGVRL